MYKILMIISLCGYCRYSFNQPILKSTNFIIKDSSYWNFVKPSNFIDTLKKYTNSVFCISVEPKENWFNEKLIVNVKKELENNTPAALVYSMNENNEHDQHMHSTVSMQAKFILEGYKKT
jgi:hypothetical protein